MAGVEGIFPFPFSSFPSSSLLSPPPPPSFSMPKLLVAGDVRGHVSQLYARVEAVHKSVGPFDALLCVGDFFPAKTAGSASAIPKEVLQYMDGHKKAPLPTFFLGSAGLGSFCLDACPTGGPIASSVSFLGRAGVTTVSGVRIAFLSGQFDLQAYNHPYDATRGYVAHYNQSDVDDVKREAGDENVDLLLTNEWPRGFHGNLRDDQLPGLQDPTCRGHSPIVASLVAALRPRYHFCGREGIYYERAPFRTPGVSHVTRMIALADVGNAEKRKWLYALNIQPMALMTPSDVAQVPPNTTDSPFTLGYTGEAFKRNGSNLDGPGLLGDAPVGDGSSKRSRRERPPPDPRSQHCWFCLASPQIEKHLIVSIGQESYVALAKGPLVEDHVLVLPIEHHASTASLNREAHEEIWRYVDCLRRHFDKEKKGTVVFERCAHTKGMLHGHLQVIPVPESKAEDVAKAFMEEGRRQNMRFEEVPSHQPLAEVVGRDQYFFVELPNRTRIIHRIQREERHRIQFGREVLASVLGMPERGDWKACQVTQSTEEHMTTKFKAAFKAFDWTLH